MHIAVVTYDPTLNTTVRLTNDLQQFKTEYDLDTFRFEVDFIEAD